LLTSVPAHLYLLRLLLQAIGASHAAAALGMQHSVLPEGRGNGLAVWRQ
jgi:hypothetical protein